MTPEQTSIAKRAIASKHWKWLPGMLVRGLYQQYAIRLSDYGEMVMDLGDFDQLSPDNSTSWTEIHDTKHGVYPGPFCPDFSDPATFGCLLFLIRTVYSADWIDVVCEQANDSEDGGYIWRVNLPNDCRIASTEAEALVVALETAP